MSHIVFFSYARENLDRYLEDFFSDLCREIAPLTAYAADSNEISFRDKKNLRLMENWKTHIEGALQSSSVLVCVTSVAYFSSEFCGKEYYVFDQRRRQGMPRADTPPPLILPVVWAPVKNGLPDFMNDPQQVPKDVTDSYRTDGLRHFKRFKPQVYRRCVTAFAQAIYNASEAYPKLKPLANVMPFPEIPNAFQDGDWQEAADPSGWIPGPEVANFVFATGSREDIPVPQGRYGLKASEWRPYLPPEPATILDYARNATRGRSFKFREIVIGDEKSLNKEVEAARERKNLTVVVADPAAAPLASFKSLAVIEKHWWDGTALLLPCDDKSANWHDPNYQIALRSTFPVLSQAQHVNFNAIRTAAELQSTLDQTLLGLRNAVTQSATAKREKTGPPPPAVNGTGAGDAS